MAITKIVDDMRTTTVLDGAKVTTGTIPEARITSLDSTKLTGTIAVGRLGNAPATDLTPVRQDLAMLALYSASEDNKAAYNLPRSFIDHFQDDTGTTTRTDCNNAGEYFTTVWSTLGAPEQPDFDNPVQNNTTVGAAFYQMAYVLNSTSGYVDIKTTKVAEHKKFRSFVLIFFINGLYNHGESKQCQK